MMIEALEDRTLLSFSTPLLSFEGQGGSGSAPPDTVGDVGVFHYIQATNCPGACGTSVTIYNKSDGSVAVPQFELDSLAPGATGGTAYTGRGDPIVTYDQLADRWLLMEFTPSGTNQIHVFISDTETPSGNGADWTQYWFTAPNFPDYPKITVWDDAYFIGTNEFDNPVYAMPRQAMLAGTGGDITAQVPSFSTTDRPNWPRNHIMPVDIEGHVSAPSGSPGMFIRQVDDEFTTPATANAANDFLELWEFTPNFATAAPASYTLAQTISIDDFDYRVGATSRSDIAQPGTTNQLDALPHYMGWRVSYRNLGTHEAIVGNFTVDANEDATPDFTGGTSPEIAGVHWFELRRVAGGVWQVHQEQTYSPDNDHRWMASTAMNLDGDIAVGFSKSSSTTFPSIAYAGRQAADPLGTLLGGDHLIVAGTGVETGTQRWGDYSSMNVDPVDDGTFWYTQEYIATTASFSWNTRIGAAAFDDPDVNIFATGGNDDILVRRSGSNIEVLFNSTLVKSLDSSATNSLTINSRDGDDVLTIDHTGGAVTTSLTFKGDSGNDRIIVTGDFDYTLTDTLLVNPGGGSVVLEDIEQAILTGGLGDNTLDASAFTLGSVTLDGGSGNDTLLGSSGVDLLLGGIGVDELQQTADADQVLTDTQVTGDGPDVLSNIEQAVLTGGSSDNTLDASAFTPGSVTLVGLGGDDSLYGSTAADSLDGGGGNDLFVALAGNDTLSGGTGVDELQQTADADQVLTDNLVTGDGPDVLSNIEQAVLTGGSSDNTLDASAFTPGSVTLVGLGGDDSLFGSTAADSLDGGTGVDELRQTADTDQMLTDNLVTGDGPDVLSSIELAALTGGNSDNRIDAADFSGTATLVGGQGNDTLLGAAGDDSLDGGTGTDEIQQVADADQVLVDNSLTGDGNDTLNSIERAVLTGGGSNNTLDPSGFTLGPVTLLGLAGNDTLHGSPGNDLIDGGTGSDQVRQTVNTDQVLTNTSLSGQGSDLLVSIEEAVLTGGASNNDLDAGGFSAGPVTLVGADGNDTLTGTSTSDTLDGGPDTDTGRVIFDGNLVLTDSTVVGPGSDTLIAIERFTITGGSGDNHFDASAYTLGSVTLDGAGGNDTLLGSTSDDTLIGGAGTDTVEQTVDGNQALSDTTLQGLGTDSLSGFEQAVLSGGASDNLIDAESFTGLGVTLAGAAGDDTLLGSSGNDSLDGGAGTDIGGQSADADQVATSTSLVGHGTDILAGIEGIRLTGGAGDNSLDATGFTAGPATLSGGNGDDTLRGTPASDSLDGGDGTDLVVQVTGSNQVLTNTTLTGLGLDVLSQVERASLTGDNQSNHIDASAFTAGPVTVSGLFGDDTVAGSSSDDTLDGGNGLDVLSQASDTDQVLTNSTLTGYGNDTHSSFERVQLAGGVGDNRLDAQAFTSGSVELDGGDGNDTLIGSQSNDTLIGGSGTDQVEQSVDGDQVLTNTQLTGRGNDTLSSIESGVLSGGSSANLITAEAFTNGPVTLDGGSGNDTLIGSPASDSLTGGSGTDRVRQTADNDQVATDSQLTGQGTDSLTSIENVELIGGSSANRLNTSAFSRGSTTLVGAGGDDTLLGSPADDSLDGGTGNDQVEQSSDADQVLTSSNLTGRGNDLLAGIEQAVLTGGLGNNTIDATGFDTGNTTLTGSDGDDTLLGSPGDDQIDGGPGADLVVSTGDFDHVLSATSITGAGNDTLVDIETAHLSGGDSANTLDASGFAGDTTLEGGDGDDTLLGGSGVDLVLQTVDADQVLTTTSLTGLGQNTLSDIDQAMLVGGDAANQLDASAFTPGPVTLDGAGGDDTLLGSAGDDQITGGAGTDLIVSTGTANQVLSDTLLQADSDDTLSGIEQAELHGSGGDNLLDATAFSGDTTLHGSPGDDTLSGGTGSDLVRQTVDADQVLTDSQLTGNGSDVISGIEFAWLTGGGSDNAIDARDFSSGPVTLDGAAGNDTLLGGAGDDRLVGSDGVDQVQQQSDDDQVLTDSLLTGLGSDEIEGIEEAQLNGGGGDNLLDATAFNNGPVTLSGLAGNDTLRGSAGNDSLSGGDGTDLVEQTTDADQALSNTQLVGRGTDDLDGVETAHLVGGSGDNVISASTFTLGQVTLDGAAGDDNLTGGSKDDLIIAGDGDDVANGRGGDDMIIGGDGNDVFTGGGGGDTLLGDAGDDSLDGQGGRDSILGSDGNDWLNGNGSPDTVVGGRGDDQLLGGTSGDVLNGSSGNDSVDGGDGSDRIFGGSGSDVLDGGTGADRLNGQGGSGDVVLGNDGDDTVQGGAGDDVLDGGIGFDELRESGNVDFLLEDTALGGQGSDQISSFEAARLTGGKDANVIETTGFSGPVTLRGSGGNDLLRSSSFDDLLLGGNGDDTLESGSGLDTLRGGDGTDRAKTSGDGDYVITDTTFTGPASTGSMAEIEAVEILAGPGDNVLDASGFTGNTTLWGGGGRDVITGGIGDDWLNGNDGQDELVGGGGRDLIHGGAGDDLIAGGDGDDTINGEAGDDTIDGGNGDDRLNGEDGRDRLLGRDGDDSLYGGTGNDELLGHSGRDRLNGEAGNDTLLGDLGPDALWGGNGDDVISGDDDDDRLYGQSGNDTLLGSAGDDRLQGGSDRDVLGGGDGDDTLNGQKDYDTLMGGDGRDRFNSFDSTAVVNELFALPDELFTAIDQVRNG